MLSTSSTRMYAFQILSTIRQLRTIRAGFLAEREQDRRLVAFWRSRSRVDRRRRRSGSRACPDSRRPIAPGRRRAAQARCRSASPRPDATAHYPLQRPSRVLDTRAAAAYDSICAWLTLESRSSIEARRLEGLLLRVRVALVAAPERG